MRSPAQGYTRLLRADVRVSPLASLVRPALVTAVIGTAAAISATDHVTLPLVISLTVCWSVAVGIQLIAALFVIIKPARHTLGLPRALDLFFVGHAPWSLWLLAFAAWAALVPPVGRTVTRILVTGVIPAVWTAAIIVAFFRTALGLSRREAVRRTLLHQVATWAVFIVIYGMATQLLPRLLRMLYS